MCGNTQPLCSLLENNFQGSMFSRARPPQRKQPLCGHTQPLCTLLENNFQGPMCIRVGYLTSKHNWKTIFRTLCSPRPAPHITNNHFVGTHNDCVGYWTLKHYRNTPFRAMFIRGSPSTTPTTVWAQYKTTLWLNTTGNQLSEPHHDHGPPSQHKQPLCGHTQQLCGIFDLNTPLENNFQSPMFTKTRPPQHKQPLCG